MAPRRKSEITRARRWPHQVAISADKLHVLENNEVVHSAAALSAAPLTHSLRQDDLDYVAFRFTKPEHAKAVV